MTATDGVTPLDLTGATLQLVFLASDGTRIVRTALPDGNPTLGVALYVTQAGDLAVPGKCKLQLVVTYVGSVLYSEVDSFKVKANI